MYWAMGPRPWVGYRLPLRRVCQGRAPGPGLAVDLLHLPAQFVYIRRLAVREFSEDALAHHVEHHQFIAPIADVLQHHAVHLRALRGIDEPPGFFHSRDRGHLHKGVFAALHGFGRHGRVPPPGRCDHRDINIATFEQPAVSVVVAGVQRRRRIAEFGNDRGGAIKHRLVRIADCRDPCAHDIAKMVDESDAALAYADQADANGIERRRRQAHDRTTGGGPRAIAPARLRYRKGIQSRGSADGQCRLQESAAIRITHLSLPAFAVSVHFETNVLQHFGNDTCVDMRQADRIRGCM